ncbi:helix-turn-helix domain-containing protein [Enterococcus faecium]|uniref:helix-turn-helix domain-containing protein n=1 Tax=Enterococcus faecium TaxID=1352 RepID=UPI00280FB5BE|nr:helix-turn-helix domain-containing protein [Enterococcus faecium]MDQ8386187.1 helix-turn-helix domain-containing protein [Enterococcus faecium]
MIHKLILLKKILTIPFALYQEKICIYDQDIYDSELLLSLSRRFWNPNRLNEVRYGYLSKKTVIAITFQNHLDIYLLILIPENGKKIEWENIIMELKAAVAILSNSLDLSPPSIDKGSKDIYDPLFSIESTVNMQDFLDNYHLEKIFMKHLVANDTIILYKILSNLSKINQTSLSTDNLRSMKYRVVSFITLITRASISHGCPINLSYRLSDLLIQKLDNISSIHELHYFIKYLINEFSLLNQTKANRYPSDIVNKAVEYIYCNLYEKITNKSISTSIGVNENYLSTTFKKVTNCPLRTFINNARIEESKYLLCYSDLSLKEISELLYFSNQSHFSKIFRQKTSFTPKEYRFLF